MEYLKPKFSFFPSANKKFRDNYADVFGEKDSKMIPLVVRRPNEPTDKLAIRNRFNSTSRATSGILCKIQFMVVMNCVLVAFMIHHVLRIIMNDLVKL